MSALNKKEWVCNCKSLNITDFHDTKVYDDGICYFCGHYALERDLKHRRNKALPKKLSKRTHITSFEEFKVKYEKITLLRNEGLTFVEIAYSMDISISTVERIKGFYGSYKAYKDLIDVKIRDK